MNLRRPPKPISLNDAIFKDVSRFEYIVADCRKLYGKTGPFLFGKFTLADAMFAPLVTRLHTYAFTVTPTTLAYMNVVMQTAAFQSWKAAASLENQIVPEDEVD